VSFAMGGMSLRPDRARQDLGQHVPHQANPVLHRFVGPRGRRRRDARSKGAASLAAESAVRKDSTKKEGFFIARCRGSGGR
jgi:hypothetical protein